MSRCKACDYCDTTGEMSPYKWGLTTPNYSGKFYTDAKTGDIYCGGCWVDMYDLFVDQMIVENEGNFGYGPLADINVDGVSERLDIHDHQGWPVGEVGGVEVEIVEPRNAGRNEETNHEG